MGVQLEQLHKDTWVPSAFFFRKCSSAERNYNAFDRELLAAYAAFRHFCHFVEAKLFTVYTDHKPLTFFFAILSDRSSRQSRHLSYIAEFTTDIRHVHEKCNAIVQILSRIETAELQDIGFRQLAKDQATFIEISAYRTAITGLSLKDIPLNNTVLLCNLSLGKPRPVVPKEWTFKVFQTIHLLLLAGPRPTNELWLTALFGTV